MKMKPIDRTMWFIESTYDIRLINVGHETKDIYRPMIKFDTKEKIYYIQFSLSDSKYFLLGKALELILMGRVY
ncbi:hypothetical protein ORI89_06405 [Sphingobacterium sp. UT-1RO-CII-1]|uniref:hypothetical protein n=1 Tax=Sphingobacterium sp. UT-1RO-CII-1 TaxID=2995225 RepID=UPI00227CB442|nr:hypothetical protein [Sphingobacterium sp. UT-1RO-CII-1]MCY4779273.1 hypothetical protein [Sphingobacterium sp. UT-1RO-CII-1]